MGIVFDTLEKYCSWALIDKEEIKRFLEIKIYDEIDGWYRDFKVANPDADFKRYGHILRQDNIARILRETQRRQEGSEVIMVGQGTIDASPPGGWYNDVSLTAKELFPILPHPRKSGSFYCVINSFVSRYRHKGKKIRLPLTKEERAEQKDAQRRLKKELTHLGGGNPTLGSEFAHLYEIGALPT